ncbi:cyclohexanone monooxygenase [Aspergillus costaricaensis CBS 115574]|uniref:Cyclohexanone monooxygenase n=1 Tax=Aspergillus costaricaensis CBS 115574 TaxID=1448317 RepID=A0ACD1I4I4_9EURO|nr:cyclohexanone monooxygenase [Aspergillus costaricaensis CBS 115574]RAK85152.1 cyclohexanone monooxygenase [Aspergillus costaricaensis CBS 115574]
MSHEYCLDALVVGTGFSGIYTLYTLVKEGLAVQAIEKESDVGGTWYVNRYPGALSDSWSHVYRYAFDEELLQTHPVVRRYSTQPEILDYLKNVVEKHDLRNRIHFNTEMIAARWDDIAKVWRVQCRTGYIYRVKYLVTAVGVLVKPKVPNIPGLKGFKGRVVHTAAWDPSIQVKNKRVGVIGVGSSGVQVVTAIASKVKSLHVFIRTPQYTIPANDKHMTPEEQKSMDEKFPQVWSDVLTSRLGMGFLEHDRPFMSVSPKEREKILEHLWRDGNGIQMMFAEFSDIAMDAVANEEVCRFLRRKIAEIVKDPEKRAVLTPKEAWNRRPLSDAGFYEQFNRENVYAIDIKKYPITKATAEGICTSDGKLHELDVIIVATGFDAMDRTYAQIDIQGREKGETLYDRWKRTGPDCYLGCSVAGFPNLLTVLGPRVAFGNVPPLLEIQVSFLRDAIRQAQDITRHTGQQCEIEATEQAEREWTEVCEQIAKMLLFNKGSSWMFRKNVPGDATSSLFYFGGLGAFRAKLEDTKVNGFAGFKSPLGPAAEARAQL